MDSQEHSLRAFRYELREKDKKINDLERCINELKEELKESHHELSTMDKSRVGSSMESFRLKPSLESESISSLARRKQSDDIFVKMPLYYHWLAITLYNVYNKFSKFSIQTCVWTANVDGLEISVDPGVLREVSNQLDQLPLKPEHDEKRPLFGVNSSNDIGDCELTKTMCFSMALNTLMKNSEDLRIVHQGPVRKKPRTQGPDSADMLGVRFQHGKALESIFVSDLKLHNDTVAEKETALYAKFAAVSSHTQMNQCIMVAGLSGTPKAVSLWIYLVSSGKVSAIPIVSSVVPSNISMLATLSVALQYLSKKPLLYSIGSTPQPLQEVELQPIKVPHVFLKVDGEHKRVLKFFDSDDPDKHSNIEVLRLVDSSATINNVTEDGRIICVNYQYREGDHSPKTLKQFKNIILMLQTIHSNGYIHGDIRLSNLVFDSGDEGYVIDYDLSRKFNPENPPSYPVGYLNDPSFRHKSAYGTLAMAFEHDSYSLGMIISQHYPEATEIIELLKCNNLSEALTRFGD